MADRTPEHRVPEIAFISIGNEDALEVFEHLLRDLRAATPRDDEDGQRHVAENPQISRAVLLSPRRLVAMDNSRLLYCLSCFVHGRLERLAYALLHRLDGTQGDINPVQV